MIFHEALSGFWISLAQPLRCCAPYSAVTPAAMAFLPLIGLEFLGAKATEYVLVGLSVVVGSVSLILGYRRHRSVYTLVIFSCGLTLLILGQVTETCGVEGATSSKLSPADASSRLPTSTTTAFVGSAPCAGSERR